MDVTECCTTVASNTNEMKPFEVHHRDMNCDLNPSEEIVIQMDDDGYRVTTSNTADTQNNSVRGSSPNLSGEESLQEEIRAKSTALSLAMLSRGAISSYNAGAPEGFRVEVDNFGDKIYKCECCEYTSAKKTALLRDHYNHEHKKKVLECTECTYSTMRYKTLQQHRQNRHGLLAMECLYEADDAKCTFRSILEDVMIEHYATKHGIQKERSTKRKEIYDRNILMKYKREGPDGKPVRRPHKHRLDRSRRVFDTIREENEKGGYTYT